MGGRLFNFDRMPQLDYLEREAEVRAVLEALIPVAYRIPLWYGAKVNFGDMDVLIAERADWLTLRAAIALALGVTEVKIVGNVFSMAYRGLQVDLFTVEPEYLNAMWTFMSYNDVGNFIGRVARRFNLKYGERGLSYVYRRAAGNYTVDLPVTQDFARVCLFLGLDYERWCEGFHELSEVFDWVISSRCFSVAPYLDDGQGDSKLRKDGVQRTNVAAFIAYLKEHAVDKRYEYADRHSYLASIVEAFPEARLEEQIAKEQVFEARAELFRTKFNGKLVMRLCPELRGPKLGEFIQALKSSVPDFESWVLDADPLEIETRVLSFHEACSSSPRLLGTWIS